MVVDNPPQGKIEAIQKVMIEEYRRLKKRADRAGYELRAFLRPLCTNTEQISSMCDDIKRFAPPCYGEKEFCIAVIMRLYSPESLVSKKRVKSGVSSELAKALHTNKSYVSKLIDDVRARYQLIDGFRDLVEDHCSRIA